MAVHAADSGSAPCGLLVDLSLFYPDGKIEKIISDKSWKATNKEPAGGWTKAIDESWENAEEIFPYGKGPWGGGR